MTHFVVMQGWQNEGESFDALYTDLQSAIKRVENMLGGGRNEYFSILKVEADHPELTDDIGFREEAQWKCQCGKELVAGIGSEEQSVFYDLHRDKLNHDITFVGSTCRLLMENKK